MTVETALAVPLLILIFFGVVEIGIMADSVVELTRVTREAARGASRGWTPSQVSSFLQQLRSIDPETITVECEYQPLDPETGEYGAWQPLTSVGSFNSARDGDRVRVVLTCEHKLISGGLFGGLVDDPQTGTTTLSATATFRRD
ncbi:MAG: TadE family protein [Armatimonadota bacterium]